VKAAAPSTTQRLRTQWRGANLIATKTIVAINVIAFVWVAIADQRWDGLGPTSARLALFGPAVHFNHEWYRTLSYSVDHFGFIHIGFNMLILWMVGRVLEPGTGPWRFFLLYVVSVLGGAAGAMIASPHIPTGGASGGVFGVAAAATLVMQRQGIRFWDTGFGPLLLFNLILVPFVVQNVSIGGHIGGLIAGALATEVMLQSRKINQPVLGWLGAVFVGGAAFLICIAAAGG
jgi:membrane associated rhomboid family serine protease